MPANPTIPTTTDESRPDGWDCGMTDNALGGYRITALADPEALEREGQSLGLPLTSYAWRCVEEGLRLFRFEGPGDWIVVLSPTDTGWEVEDILAPGSRQPTKSVDDVAEAWSLLYAGVLPPGRLQLTADGHESDNDSDEDEDEDDDGRPRCPICRSADDCDHHVATVEIEEGICGGVLYGAWWKGGGDWGEAAKALTLSLAEAVLAGRADPAWDHGLNELYKSLHGDLADLPGLTIPGPPTDPDDDWDTGPVSADELVDSDEWREAWCNAGGDWAVRNHLQQWLGKQPGVHQRDYEIAHSPGLTWEGRSYYAKDAKDVARRFVRAFCGPEAEPGE